MRTTTENYELFLRVAVKKAFEYQNFGELLRFISRFRIKLDSSDELVDWMSSVLLDGILENEEKLTLRQIISLRMTFEVFPIWIDHHGLEEVYEVFHNLLDADFIAAAEFFEYMTFENIHMAPTYNEWRSFSGELLTLPPILLLDFIAPERRVDEFRNSFYPKLLKDLRRDEQGLFEMS